MAKQEKDRFSLNKGGNRRFDIHKGSSRKFDLSKDDIEEVTSPEATVTPKPDEVVFAPNPPQPMEPASVNPVKKQGSVEIPIEEATPAPKKSKVWLWALIGIAVVLAFIGMAMLNKTNKDEASVDSQVENTVVNNDSIGEDVTDPVDNQESTSAEVANEQKVTSSESSTPDVNTGVVEIPVSQAGSEATATNAIRSVPTVTGVSNDIEVEALNVIKGTYGDGNERKSRLGVRYAEIQNRVNELKRAGKF
ncbi:MAG: hypothetical protein HDS64_05125 [Bacteroidales bacterium]|nr:hypothetical protein [Bacteroidales bacterium]